MMMTRSEMTRFTEANYKAASAWYKAKYDILDRKIQQDNQKSAETLAQDIETKMLPMWQKYVSELSGSGRAKTITSNPKYHTEEYEFPILEKKHGHINRLTADGFEKAFEHYLSNWFSKVASSELETYATQQTGKIMQEGLTFATGQQKMIRPDVALFNKEEWKVNESSINKPVELLTEIDYSGIEKRLNELTTEEYVQQVLQLLNGNITGYDEFYGFSLKNYTHQVHYTSSSRLKKQLNEEMKSIEWGSRRAYMEYFLSKYIIAITSPTVIGLVKQDSFEWMHDVLRRQIYAFVMKKSSNGAPQATSSIILKDNDKEMLMRRKLDYGKVELVPLRIHYKKS